ncbi:fimbria/pilus outer membrane usher protein [Yersinia mollaretii]|uniref:Outer membrane fimbrial usher protein n=1 Tax=Yersinia mollaretii TaxID=33060 RepID=A0AA36PKP2_YERMO|nr:fimbria/pilus outer membrane usher protein [Yersinia mollaretii]MDA5527592.1 fimbria/pilus outer membrane usher protein [Yersinia mollaretii]MDR7875129.1 fimbria/pilus outer membrane usher protein [Yersinia mollaretii]PHZ32547.1 hypothetical protein CS537_05985 [Yersinia mollaretii]WQC74792.1 fimbria/pilus outer membrane usher protein [Yersinia mollaretii]CND98653.1 Outer membrane fimbrial usher protein [Yersinia mollaretii]
MFSNSLRHSAINSLTLAIILFSGTSQASSDGWEFDANALKQMGYNPAVAEFFQHGSRFQPGTHDVLASVNGNKAIKIAMLFGIEGESCFTTEILEKLAIKTNKEDLTDNCPALKKIYPSAIVTADPTAYKIDIIVPPEALIHQVDQSAVNAPMGGWAGVVNYSVNSMRSNNASGSSNQNTSANTEIGFNMANWIVRSQQSYSHNKNQQQFSMLSAYAQRSFASQAAVLQLGDISLRDSVFSGPGFLGAQWFPETALYQSTGASVSGIAQTQAKVEVRQSGVLIYSMLVPPGPFTLDNIPVIDTRNDLQVTVDETQGQQQYVVPINASIADIAPPIGKGFAYAVGQTKGKNSTSLVSATGNWVPFNNVGISAGVLAASDYYAFGWAANSSLIPGGSLSFNQNLAQTSGSAPSQQGIENRVSMGFPISSNLSSSFSVTQRNAGYRNFGDEGSNSNIMATHQGTKLQYTAGLGWSAPIIGGGAFSYSRAESFAGNSSHGVSASWARSFDFATLNLNVQKNLQNVSSSESGTPRANKAQIYASVSIPLGKSASLRGYSNRRQDGTRQQGVSYGQQVNEQLSYSLAWAKESNSANNSYAASINGVPYYTRASASYSQSSGNNSMSGSLNGGIVIHNKGVTFSPYSVQNTLGIVSVGTLSGIPISTPSGTVWTDAWGQAVVPQLAAYGSSNIQINAQNLPKNIDVKNGVEVKSASGTVQHISLEASLVQRFLLDAVDTQGLPLAAGGEVTNGDGDLLAFVTAGGQIFISGGTLKLPLMVSDADDNRCQLDFTPPETVDTNSYFTTAAAQCRPVSA